ncbi:MAG: PfkB family carbohydrate kinase [Candidatus Hodarchaeales archaeon]|jgi:sugar/nucleoside kinase (ribokinase family)/fructoselysine-6-P-deglycase FrlB-like protein
MLEDRTEKKTIITSVGLISVDHVFIKEGKEIEYLSSTGGGSASNTSVYLAALGNNSNIIGVIGDDDLADIATMDFKRLNVNIGGLISRNGHSTRQISHLINLKSKKDHKFSFSCPFCDIKYSNSLQFRGSYLKNLHYEIIKSSDLLHLDRISNTYLALAELAKKNKIPIIVDLGTVSRRFVKKELIQSAIKVASIIQLPSQYYDFFLKKLDIKDFWEVNPNLVSLIVTANNGFIYLYVKYKEKIHNIRIVIEKTTDLLDSGGAGDTFLAFFVNALKKRIKNFTFLNDLSLDHWKSAITEAHEGASESCQYYSARGYLYAKWIEKGRELLDKKKLLNIYGRKLTHHCTCGENENHFQYKSKEKSKHYKRKKGRNLYEGNLLNIPSYVSLSLADSIQKNGFHEKSFNEVNFIGSGGSYVAASALSYIFDFQHKGNSKFLTPFDYVLLEQKSKPVVLISSGGTNPDIKAAFQKSLELNAQKTCLITSNPSAKLYSMIKNLEQGENILIKTPWKERGFVSILDLIATILLGARLILSDTWSEEYQNFSSEESLNSLLESAIKRQEAYITSNLDLFGRERAKHIIALGSGWAWPAVLDLESKTVESGLSTIEISDLKNYTHGRYMSLYKEPEGKIVILFKTPKTSKLVDFLQNKLSQITPVFILESKDDDFRATIDLLIQGSVFLNELGIRKNIDLAKPGFPEEARGLYEWNQLTT